MSFLKTNNEKFGFLLPASPCSGVKLAVFDQSHSAPQILFLKGTRLFGPRETSSHEITQLPRSSFVRPVEVYETAPDDKDDHAHFQIGLAEGLLRCCS